jgi:uncharacterized membrane protein
LAGIAGLIGLASFYKGLALEHIGMVASLAAVLSAAMPQKKKYPVVCLTGFFDAAGTALYAPAAHVGRLDISAVLSSMHPAITAFLAWMVLKERLSRRKWFGVVAALFALALIAG